MGSSLTGGGWVCAADDVYQRACMTSSGRVRAQGIFVAATVKAITGGSSPQMNIRHGVHIGAPQIRTVAATPGATVDQRASPDACPNGIYLEITGGARNVEVEVLWR